MSLITCYDADGNPHEKEPVDAREACLHNGFTMTPPGTTAIGAIAEYVPTKQELLAARDDLLARQMELDACDQRLIERSGSLDQREQALAERELASQLKAGRLAAVQVAGASGPDVASMTKAQLQAALEEKGVKFPATADKAELQSLLTAAQTA